MAEQNLDNLIPPANTPAEINIHLGYIRRDIIQSANVTAEAIKGLKEDIGNLDDHFVSDEAFKPMVDQLNHNTADIGKLKEFRDTLNGKLVGFGVGISAATSVITFALVYFFNK